MATVEAITTTATVNLTDIEGEIAADAADVDEEIVTILPTEDTEEAIEEEEPLLLDAQDIAEAGNLWERTRSGFKLDLTLDNERIAAQRNWYSQHQSHLDRVTLRAARYLHYTVSEAEQRGIPTELALLPVIESSYNPFAYSHASAAGMWQFIPGTGKIFGLKQNWWFDGRRDVIESTRAAYDFLTQLHSKFGSWELALAAYNAGPGAVQRSINRNLAEGLPADFWSLRLPSETMSYVPRFLAMAQLIKSPESFGVSLRPIMDQPYFRVVDTNGQIDLE
ncbi:MAG: transglycosylase SLT domain-containing protein, partial [Moraxellaceae bacterium]